MDNKLDLKRILIADDELGIRFYLESILKKYYEVETVENGKLALEILPQFRPDLILLDVNMPVMDGYETYNKILE